MGKIRCLEDSLVPETHGKFIDVSNWRYVKKGSYHDKDGLFMVLNTCRLFFIAGLIIDEFHNINYENLTVKKHVVHIRNVLTCPDCNGFGVVDWLQNVTKFPPKRTGYVKYFDYVRDKKGLIKEVYCDEHLHIGGYKTLTISTPIKEDEMYYCTTCHGSGLRLGRRTVLRKEFFLKEC